MVDLKETSPCAGLLPVQIGQTALREVPQTPVWSVAPFAQQHKAVAGALKTVGLSLPEAGGVVKNGEASVLWFGHDQMLVMGVASLPPMPAAVSDQSDGWTCVRIQGQAVDVLARLAPVDLRHETGVVRTLIGHMTAVIIAREAGAFDVMVMRSMAKTLVHDLTVAATGVAARG